LQDVARQFTNRKEAGRVNTSLHQYRTGPATGFSGTSGFTTFLFGEPYTFSKPDKPGSGTAAIASAGLGVVYTNQGIVMNLLIWLPLTFVLGLGSLALCLAFIDACDRI
jgi:hypothetical protein